MSVWIDSAEIPYRRMIMCHMMADTLEELHAMADKIGVNRKWFQPESSPHYDICLEKKKLALAAGAQEADRYKIVELIRKYREEKKAPAKSV